MSGLPGWGRDGRQPHGEGQGTAAKSPRGGGPHALSCRDGGAQSCRVCSGWHLGTRAPNVPEGRGKKVWPKPLQHGVGTGRSVPMIAGAGGGLLGGSCCPRPHLNPIPSPSGARNTRPAGIPGGTVDIQARGQPEHCHGHPRTTALFPNPKTALFPTPKPGGKGPCSPGVSLPSLP